MYNNALPVDPHQPNQWAYINGLPNQVPYVPPINCSPRIMPYLQLVAGHALLEAQSHAGRNPLRTTYFNLLSSNNYQNAQYPELVQACAELAEFLMASKHLDIQQAAQQAAHVMNSVFASMQMEKYPALKAMLPTDLMQGSTEWLQYFQNLAGEINRYSQAASAPGYGNAAPGGYRPPMGNIVAPGVAPPITSMWDTSGSGHSSGGSSGFFGGLSYSPGVRQAEDNLSEVAFLTDRPDPILVRSTNVTTFGNPTPAAPPATTPAPADAPVSTEVLDRPFDRVTTEDGSVIVPASQSSWTVSHLEDRPYRMAYRPSTHCLFHGLHPDHKTVEEVLVPWHESNRMDYLKHELRSDLRSAQPKDPNAPRVVPSYDMLRFMSPVTDNILAVDETLAEEAKAKGGLEPINAVTQVQVGFFTDLDSMILAGTLERELVREEGEAELVACAEIYGDIAAPMVCSEADVAWMMTARRCTQLMDLIALIDGEGATLTEAVRKTVIQRVTDEINVGLKYNLQLEGFMIDNFMDDYVDLLGVLKQTFGERMEEVLQQQEAGLISRALNVLSGERLAKYLRGAHGEAAVEKLSRRTLVFTDRVGVTYVEWKSEDMDLAFTGSGALSEADMPELYAAVQAIFERTAASELPFAHHLMRTADGVILEFHQGWLGKGFYLISKMQG